MALEGLAPSEGEMSEKREAEEELLRLEGIDSHPKQETGCVSTLHSGNLIACRFNSDNTLIATGSADRTVKVSDAQTRAEKLTVSSHAAPILSVAWSPTDPHILVSSDMNGSVLVTDAHSGAQLGQFKDHHKYAHRAAWSPNGRSFATCGHDRKVSVYTREEGGEGFVLARQREMVTLPEAICFLDDGVTLVVSCRDDNYFHYLDTGDGTEMKVNMNALGDDHVSFTVLDMVLSPNGKMLLASTDRSRLILFVVGTCHQLRNYYGAVNDQLVPNKGLLSPLGEADILHVARPKDLLLGHSHPKSRMQTSGAQGRGEGCGRKLRRSNAHNLFFRQDAPRVVVNSYMCKDAALGCGGLGVGQGANRDPP
eukprot:CAMPEP_0169467070 /NCGR_PEP_ID=MMETSP1042-20121227/22125_1 /TAXON_ID=464988 /ORGANISM="Hemiselmis andersenii, Strain CCMP1180" /LENGTH=366 /DNA_ID=CAMNT_0009580205 /DNA_START=42 /DNA_END=1137 /DNA_ORIENTATION=-